MQKLSGLDAAFVYLESPQAPMHVGGVYIFDASTRSKRFDFDAFRRHVASRLHVSRTLRQRLVRVPLNLDHPYWIEDPDFDLDAHLSHTVLPKPGDWQALMHLAEQVFSRVLDRDRPLWEITFVEELERIPGVAAGSFAILAKAHHAAVDGVSGEEMIWALLDPTAEPGNIPAPAPWRPERPPSRRQLLAWSMGKVTRQPLALARLAGQVGGAAVQVVKERVFKHTPLPPLLLSAPSTCFNTAVTAKRVFRGIMLSLEKIKKIKNIIPGATVNDVVLAICAGALRRYLDGKQELPDKPLVATVPISVRAEDELGDMGNRVSAMLVSLATDQEDPLERLAHIHVGALDAKVYSKAMSADKLIEFIPSTTTALMGHLYCRLEIAQKIGPLFNLFITNVPGPRKPLYLGGAPLHSHLGMAPVFDGLGLILVVTSYLDSLSISATACHKIMPDIDVLMHCLEESLAELEAATTA